MLGKVPRKKTSLVESLAESHAYNPIRDSGEMLGERETSRQESCQESHQESSRDSRWDFWRDFLRSPSGSPESRLRMLDKCPRELNSLATPTALCYAAVTLYLYELSWTLYLLAWIGMVSSHGSWSESMAG